ncbi:MAG TPA: homoserine dehydrogenase [Candidatus Saccharimonadales bacterium]|nr:homoserine dehydrogenase [Candidatus Saccharimonadales bacterium]
MRDSSKQPSNARASVGKEKAVNVGLIGFGNIGRGVVKYFREGHGKQFNIHLKTIAVRNISKKRDFKIELTNTVEDIFNDPEIDIVVELIGGLDPAKKYIVQAMEKGKSVVTANKAVMARNSKELFDKARKNSVDLAFEAAVGGGIPIINTLNRYQGEKIEKVMGVLNGTTNFILTQMEAGLDFDTAVKIAQDRGFAEANHILDTGGYDSRDKLALIASLIFNAEVNPEKISTRGIVDITPVDIDFADKYKVAEGGRGYAIKLLAIAQRRNGDVELRVGPALLSRDHPLASVRDEVNAVYVEGELAGPQTFSGRGAGTNPTTSAVISDILRLANNLQRGVADELPKLDSKVSYIKSDKMKQKGYIRANLKNKPGSLYEVAGFFARHGLNIEDSIQRGEYSYKVGKESFIPDIITFEPALTETIEKVLIDLKKSNRVDGDPLFMSIEE